MPVSANAYGQRFSEVTPKDTGLQLPDNVFRKHRRHSHPFPCFVKPGVQFISVQIFFDKILQVHHTARTHFKLKDIILIVQHGQVDILLNALLVGSRRYLPVRAISCDNGVRTGAYRKVNDASVVTQHLERITRLQHSGNITQMDDIIKNKPENFNVISGDDGITFPLITLGAVGVISVIGNAFPREFSRMTRLALQGDFANALAIHHRFTELFNLLFVDGNPAGVKSMLNAMGMIENKLRLPLVPTRITTFEAIRKVLNELNIKC